jgi:hypothetical protein
VGKINKKRPACRSISKENETLIFEEQFQAMNVALLQAFEEAEPKVLKYVYAVLR